MAKVTGGFTSYQAVGNREDLSDIVYNIDPFETPFVNGVGRRKITNRTFDWQVDSLPSPVSAQQEGFQVAPVVQGATTRATNVTMILSNNATVSKTQRAVEAAGRSDDMAYQMARISKGLKRDVESAVLGNTPRTDGDDTGPTARVTRGLEHWVQTNKSSGTGYVAPAAATAAGTDGTVRTFTQSLLEDALEAAWLSGATPNMILLGSKMKRKFSNFAGRSFTRTGGDTDEIIGAAEIFVSDWGPIKAVPCRNVRNRTALIVDPDYVKMAYLRPFASSDLPVSGDAVSKLMTVEFGLECSNEKAHAKVSDLDIAS